VDAEQGSMTELLNFNNHSAVALSDHSLFTPHAPTDFETLYWDVFSGESHRHYTSEEKMLLAVLVQAIADMSAPRSVRKVRTMVNWLKDDAYRWFTETRYLDARRKPERRISFEFVCEALDLEMSVVRRIVMERWKGNE